METTKEGLFFIAQLETPNGKPFLKAHKSLESNKDGSVKYEIGFGHNSDDFFTVDSSNEVTEEQAYDLLKHDIQECEAALNSFMQKHQLRFKSYQFDALVSAMYNGVPCTNLKTGIGRAVKDYGYLWAKINEINKRAAKSRKECGYDCKEYFERKEVTRDACVNFEHELKRWVYFTSNGAKIVSRGLQNRRNAEATLFLHGKYPDHDCDTFDFITLSGE